MLNEYFDDLKCIELRFYKCFSSICFGFTNDGYAIGIEL